MGYASKKHAEAFLRKVRQGLAPLPASEQEDIVAELRSHLLQRQGPRES